MYTSNDSALSTGYMIGKDSNNGCNNGGMWGNESWWFIIVLFALWGGFGGNGWGNGNNGGMTPYMVGNSYTDAAVQRGFDTQTIIGKLDGLNSGICSLGYDQLAQMNSLSTQIGTGFANVGNAICNLGYEQAQLSNATNVALMQGFNAAQAQAADCCCKTQTAIAGVENSITGLGCTLGREIERGFCDVNYNMATNTNSLMVQAANNTRDIIDSNREGTRAILDYLCQDKISTLQAENQALRLTASQQAQNATIGAMITASEANILRRTGSDCPIPAYVVPNPNCCYGPYGNYGFNGYGFGYNNNGGCNSGCCGCNG